MIMPNLNMSMTYSYAMFQLLFLLLLTTNESWHMPIGFVSIDSDVGAAFTLRLISEIRG